MAKLCESAFGNRMELNVTADRLEACLVFKTTGSQAVSSADIAELLQQNRITLDREGTVRIKQALDELNRGRLPRGGVLLKRGTTCGPSRDESINWSVPADTGTEASPLPVYRATAGEEIARIVPPEAGESGLDVYGDPLPAPAPQQLNLCCGRGTKPGPEPSQIMATENGAAMVIGNQVCVVPLIEADGGEVPTSGLDTAGLVIIRGDLAGERTISAAAGVRIEGVCGPAEICSGGPIICLGGVEGQAAAPDGLGPAKLKAGGLLSTPRLVHALVEVWGDVEVEALIQHSTVKILGELRAPAAQATGSRILVSGSIQLGDIGSFSADSHTFVAAGHHYEFRQQLDRLQALGRKISSAQAMFKQPSGGSPRNVGGRHKLVHQELTRMKTLVQQQVSGIGRQMLEYIDSVICFEGTIYASATVSVSGAQGSVGSQFTGPATIATKTVNGNNLLVIVGQSGRKMVLRSA